MKLDLSDEKKAMYLAGLKVLINSGDKQQRLAESLGMVVPTQSSAIASYHLYQKVMASELTITLTKANIKRLVSALQALSYMYSVDSDVCKMLIGSDEDLDSHLAELYAASHGKKALDRYYQSGAFSVMP